MELTGNETTTFLPLVVSESVTESTCCQRQVQEVDVHGTPASTAL